MNATNYICNAINSFKSMRKSIINMVESSKKMGYAYNIELMGNVRQEMMTSMKRVIIDILDEVGAERVDMNGRTERFLELKNGASFKVRRFGWNVADSIISNNGEVYLAWDEDLEPEEAIYAPRTDLRDLKGLSDYIRVLEALKVSL